MGFFDDILDIGGDVLGFFGGNPIGQQLATTGFDLLSPVIQEFLYGDADPRDLLTPEQLEAMRLSNEGRQVGLTAATQILPFATPEAQEAIVRREASRGAYEADTQRRRQVARGVRTPFTSNYYDNIDPIVRRALSITDPYTRAAGFGAQAASAAVGQPYQGPGDIGALARAEDLARQGQLTQAAGNILPAINLMFGGGGQPQVSGFANTGAGTTYMTPSAHGNPF